MPGKPYVQQPSKVPVKKPLFIRILQSVWFWIGVIVLLIGAFVDMHSAYEWIKNWGKTPLQQAQEEKWLRGLLIPEAIRGQNDLIIRLGNNTTHWDLPPDRITPQILDFNVTHCPKINYFKKKYNRGDELVDPFSGLRFMIKNNRIYISDTVRKMVNFEDVLVYINFDHYDIAKGEYGDVHDDDQHLEVLEKNGRVAVTLGFNAANELYIEGFFVTPELVCVVGGEHGLSACNYRDSPSDMERVKKEIATVKTHFKYH